MLGKYCGSRVRSSVDADLQALAATALRRHLGALRRQNVEDGAVIVIDNARGEVLAWVGSSGDLSAAAEVDGVTALRQAGSTLNPFSIHWRTNRTTSAPPA